MARLIDADELLVRFIPRGGDNNFTRFVRETVRLRLAEMPTIEVVRCKDCFHYHHGYGVLPEHCALTGWKTEPSDYCSSGERKDEILTYTINAGEV